MFVIWGWGGVAETIGQGTFHCPACQRSTEFLHRQMRTYFKLFFTPIIPLAAGERFVQCGTCKGSFVEAVLQMGPPASTSLSEADYVLGKRGDYGDPGTIAGKQFKRYSVRFEDGKQASLSKDEVVPLDQLEVGHRVFARPTPGADFRPGIITEFSDDQI